MKKSELERLIKVELKKMLSEGVTRSESFPGEQALYAIMDLCEEALDPKAVGHQGQVELPPNTKGSFKQILKAANYILKVQKKGRQQ
tara:strand:+ start:234 stop:494 length:261 start_codon:yes stop_codon:yes gene_type:complete